MKEELNIAERLRESRYMIDAMRKGFRPPTIFDEAYITQALRDSEELIERLNYWKSMTNSELLLRIGEMTSQEIRTVRAVLSAIAG